jgi:glyoxylase I family protein
MLRVIDIDHIVLICGDLAISETFYCQVLGLVFERRLDTPKLIQLRAGGALIDLVDASEQHHGHTDRQEEQNHLGRNMAHFCVNLAQSNEQEILQHLDKYGVRRDEFSEKYGSRGFSRSLYIYDPDGNQVELKLLAQA